MGKECTSSSQANQLVVQPAVTHSICGPECIKPAFTHLLAAYYLTEALLLLPVSKHCMLLYVCLLLH
jgi:hypothetical protein